MKSKTIPLLLATILATGIFSASAGADNATPVAKAPAAMKPGSSLIRKHHSRHDHCACPMGETGYGPGMGKMGGGAAMMGPEMGMMGGMGSGMGMRGGMHAMAIGNPGALKLTDEQRGKINQLSDELRKKHWAGMGAIMDESGKLRDLYAADKRDPAAIGQVYQRIFDQKRQMIEASIDTQNRIDEILTPEQRDRLRQMKQDSPSGACRH